jgi:predicted 3-demethylubiquinone-9 3-methyltransferase (glyoxalase superfamily)
VLVVSFRLDEQEVRALNGGPGHPFTGAFSFQIDCAD